MISKGPNNALNNSMGVLFTQLNTSVYAELSSSSFFSKISNLKALNI